MSCVLSNRRIPSVFNRRPCNTGSLTTTTSISAVSPSVTGWTSQASCVRACVRDLDHVGSWLQSGRRMIGLGDRCDSVQLNRMDPFRRQRQGNEQCWSHGVEVRRLCVDEFTARSPLWIRPNKMKWSNGRLRTVTHISTIPRPMLLNFTRPRNTLGNQYPTANSRS